MPVFCPWVHPGSLVFISHLKQSVGNAEAMFCTLAEEEQAIVIDLAYFVSAANAFPAVVVSSYFDIEISKDDEFVIWGGGNDLIT